MSSPFFPKKAAKKQALAQFRGKELVRAYFPADSPDFPIPKGDNHYAIAKRFEYVEKNLREAERHYKLAIEQKIRVESAVKDLAGVLHQQGRTLEACDLLERNKELFVESQVKFENLLQSLRTQTRNASFKYLKLWGLPKCADEWIVKSMFTNPNRIHSIFLVDEDDTQTAILQFFSLSAARKTIEGFLYASKYRLESVSLPVEVQDSNQGAAFGCHVFTDKWKTDGPPEGAEWDDFGEECAVLCLGRSLYRSICLIRDTHHTNR